MNLLTSLGLVLSEEMLSGIGLLLLLVSAWGGDKAARTISFASILALAAAAVMAVPSLMLGRHGIEVSAFSGQFAQDGFASYAKLLIYLSAAVTLVVAPKFFEKAGTYRAEFPILVLFAALGMGIMVSATDMLTLYIGLEMNSLASYVLAAMLRTDERSAEAGLKYFVLGSLASGILLFGISLTYGFTGSTQFDAIHTALGHGMSTGALFGIVFVLAGLAFKISAVPFHMWTPDVYEGAPTPVTTFFATAPKAAALALTIRVALGAFGTQSDAWQQIVMFAAIASIVVGALGAIGQGNIKRLLAYSSINNVGFMLLGLATGTAQGGSAMLVYLAIYVITSLVSFVSVLMLTDAEGNQIEQIADLAGLSRVKPGLAAALAMAMFSLAGIPPLFGFWGKFVVFMAVVKAGYVPLAALGIAASVIGAFYYLKVVKVMFFDEPSGKIGGKCDLVYTALVAIGCVFLSPLGYLLTGPLGRLADTAIASLIH
ncbi:NADH-quinone oxidoreductase subunit NuoN [Novosphingobium rosa]|uniref:NADH-quinone oxidoreductase subunit NuoN n=1 Tax=Novosphingobium rosa TaxID=76978 RepID=UPI0008361C86|nr:NADH-quinone oxidoreductase subunit NuoN [Novosphingobium rosa]